MKKYLLIDLKSGFLISLIALPLCLGIAVASGFPAISGVITAIIGGFCASFIGASRLTIKGPAAGLITIIIACVIELGDGDMTLGYQRTLAVGVISAIIQIIFSQLRVANLGFSIPKSVINAMMASIGIIIISKQIHIIFGNHQKFPNVLESFSHLPNTIANGNPLLTLIGLASLFLIFFWPKTKLKISQIIPSQMLVLIGAILASHYFNFSSNFDYNFLQNHYQITSQNLVSLPNSIMSSFTTPDFSIILSQKSIKYVIILCLIGTIESTLTVVAADNLDPKKRTSNLNKDLFSVSIANLISSLIGGLPMISEVVRTKANIDNGAKSTFANFFHAVFLLIFILALPTLLNKIPLAALAAMLVFVGARLTQIEKIRHIKTASLDQHLSFAATVILTLSADLLVGVFGGIIVKTLLHLSKSVTFRSLFFSRINQGTQNDHLTLKFHGSAAFPSLFRLHLIINQISPKIKKITIDINDVTLVDNSFLSDVSDIINHKDKIEFKLIGLEKFHKESSKLIST